MPRSRAVGLRIGAALLGSYVFVWGLVSAATLGFTAMGLTLADADGLCRMIGLLAYLSAFIWAFAARDLSRVWLTLGGGGAALSLVGWAAARTLTPG